MSQGPRRVDLRGRRMIMFITTLPVEGDNGVSGDTLTETLWIDLYLNDSMLHMSNN